MTPRALALPLLLLPLACRASDAGPAPGVWTPLFNGRDLAGWTPKIRGHSPGDNFADTFRVEDGLLSVRYDGYGGRFEDRFGHLFYDVPFSRYRLRVEYRFVGEQLPDGPGWAWRNSGVMLHGQTPESMRLDQEFPVSIEAQLLGGDGTNPRPTANLCTPGTNVVMDEALVLRHCVDSSSESYHGDRWVSVELVVLGGEGIEHIVEGASALRYQAPQLDERDADARRLLADAGLLLTGGTISLQSESHPIDFRRVEIQVLP